MFVSDTKVGRVRAVWREAENNLTKTLAKALTELYGQMLNECNRAGAEMVSADKAEAETHGAERNPYGKGRAHVHEAIRAKYEQRKAEIEISYKEAVLKLVAAFHAQQHNHIDDFLLASTQESTGTAVVPSF